MAGGGRKYDGQFLPCQPRGIFPRDKPRCSGLDIPLHTGHLSREQQTVIPCILECRTQMTRCTDKAVAVHHAVAQKLRRCQPRNHSKNTPLLRPLEMGLKSDDVVDRPRCVVLPQLHHSIWTLPCYGMLKPDRLQRTIEKRISPARSHDLDRHAALEENRFLKIMRLRRLCRRQCLPECVILRFVQGAVDIGRLALPITRGPVRHIHINAGEADERRRRIVEIQSIITEQAADRIRKPSIR